MAINLSASTRLTLRRSGCTFLKKKEELDSDILERLEADILELKRGYPLAYIRSKADFFGLEFFVNESVLIPRRETEVLVENAVSCIQKLNSEKGEAVSQTNSQINPVRMVELGVGSGCISISCAVNFYSVLGRGNVQKSVQKNVQNLCTCTENCTKSCKKHLPRKELCAEKCTESCTENCTFFVPGHKSEGVHIKKIEGSLPLSILGIEKSGEALEVARENVKKHGLQEVIELRQGDLLSELKGKFDILVANLPYVDEKSELGPGVREFEPHEALFAEDGGLELYKKVLKQVKEGNFGFKFILFEIGYDQGERMRELCGGFDVEIIKDLEGRDRVVRLEK